MKIAYITDSMTTLSKEYREKNHIYILPLEVILDGETFEEKYEIKGEDFFANIEQYKELKTSQPSIGKMVEKFEELKEKGYEKIVVFALSSKGSGAYNTYCMAKGMVDIEVEVIDSLGASFIEDGMLQGYIENDERDKERAERLTRSKFIVIPQDLSQLHRSGRVRGMAFLIGSLLKIQPILEMVDGEVVIQQKVRKKKEIEQYIVDQLSKGMIENNRLHIQHTCNEAQAEKWKEFILKQFPNLIITFGEVPVSVGVHNGRGTLIFSWFYE